MDCAKQAAEAEKPQSQPVPMEESPGKDAEAGARPAKRQDDLPPPDDSEGKRKADLVSDDVLKSMGLDNLSDQEAATYWSALQARVKKQRT